MERLLKVGGIMNIDKNNNSNIISRLAKSNLQGIRGHSFFAVLTIILAVSLVTCLTLVRKGADTELERELDKMQHVMYMNVTEEQMDRMANDTRVEMLLPYKAGEVFKYNNVKMTPVYHVSNTIGIATYTPIEGKIPEHSNEIVVDKKLMPLLGKEGKIGEEIELAFSNSQTETFKISGYIDTEYQTAQFFIYLSKEYAETGAMLKDIPYTALVRITDAKLMANSEFSAVVYGIAADYGINRMDVNTNGTFEASLQVNAGSMVMILVCLLVMFACAIVIYSIFYLSITGRVQQIGQLQTIGMTQKQIKKMITREGLMLSLIGIPLGVIIGAIIGYIIKPKGWSSNNFLWTVALAVAFGIVTTLISIRKPAQIAASVSPIEATRYSSGPQTEKIVNTPHKMLTPKTLAKMEKLGNREKNSLITVSLAIGGVLLMIGATYMNSWSVEKYARHGGFEDCEYKVSYRYSAETNPEFYGTTNLQMTGILNNELKNKIAALPYVKSVKPVKGTMANFNFEGNDFLMEVYPINKENPLEIPLKTIDPIDTSDLKDDEMVIVGTSGFETAFGLKKPISTGDTIVMRWFNGNENKKEIKIVGTSTLSTKQSLEYGLTSGIYISENLMNQLWPDMNRTKDLKITVENYEQNGALVETNLNEIIDQYPELWTLTLREQLLTAKNQSQSLTLQIYVLSIFIISFSILNMINTTLGTIATRKKEFAMLESIGMEENQILKMLSIEGILTALPSILITFFVGTVAGYVTIEIFKHFDATYLEFHFPLVVFIAYVVCMILAPVILSAICLKNQKKLSLVERLRAIE